MKTTLFLKTALTLTAIYIACSAAAQEKPIPVCNNTSVIDEKLNQKLHIFDHYKGFVQALLFKNNDSTYYFEVMYRKTEFIEKAVVKTDKTKLDSICNQINKINEQQDIDADNSQTTAKTHLTLSAMKMGLGYYGYSVPLSFNSYSGKAYTASYMFIGSAAYFIPMYLANKQNVTLGMAEGFNAGATSGLYHGWQLALILSGEDIDLQTGMALSTMASISEGVIGYRLAKNNNLSGGTMKMIKTFGSTGALYILGINGIMENKDARSMAFSTLAGSAAGMYLGYKLSRNKPISFGDASVVSQLSGIGAYISVGLINQFNKLDSDPKLYISGAIIGSLIGITAGYDHVLRNNYTYGQSYLTFLGELSGSLFGVGTAYILSSETPSSSSYLLLSGIGSLAGFIVTAKLLKQENTNVTDKNRFGLSFSINPASLLYKNHKINPLYLNDNLIRISANF